MEIKKMNCPKGLNSNPNRNMESIDYITIHETGNISKTATAENHAKLQFSGNGGKEISWHYTVDSDEIWQSYEDIQQCWHAGDGGTGKGNTCSVAIEICVNDKQRFKQACQNAAWLVSELLKKHNLTLDKIKQHHDWSGKNCPETLRKTDQWDEFLTMCKMYYDQLVSPAKEIVYCVQVGAFAKRDNAENLLSELRRLGYQPFIVAKED